MPVNAISAQYFYAGYIRSASDTTSIRKISEALLASELPKTDSYISQDQKNNIVTGQADENKNTVFYDYRYLPNVPLSKGQETVKTYNNSEKVSKKEGDKKSFSAFADFVETDEEETPAKSTGKGFYIILNDQYQAAAQRKDPSPDEKRRERILNIYSPERKRGNGVLVDLTL